MVHGNAQMWSGIFVWHVERGSQRHVIVPVLWLEVDGIDAATSVELAGWGRTQMLLAILFSIFLFVSDCSAACALIMCLLL